MSDEGESGAWQLDSGNRGVLEAIVARLIPSDEVGPGAREAGAAKYIELALASDYASLRQRYLDGLAAVDRHARAQYGHSFAGLPVDDQDALLGELEQGVMPEASEEDMGFVDLVLQHTLEGTFGDPRWGGNAGRVGWRLMGYPGPRHVWTESAQQLDVDVPSDDPPEAKA